MKFRSLPHPPEQLVKTAATYIAENFLPHGDTGLKALRMFIILLARRFSIRESRILVETAPKDDLPWYLARVLQVTLPDIELARTASDEMLQTVSAMFGAGEDLNDSAERATSQARSDSLEDISAVINNMVETMSMHQMQLTQTLTTNQQMLAETLKSIASSRPQATKSDSTEEMQRLSKSRSKYETSSGPLSFDDAPKELALLRGYTWLKDDPQAAPLRRACFIMAADMIELRSMGSWIGFLRAREARMIAGRRFISPCDAAWLQSLVAVDDNPNNITPLMLQPFFELCLLANNDVSVETVERLRLARLMPAQHDAAEVKSWSGGATTIPCPACVLPVRVVKRQVGKKDSN